MIRIDSVIGTFLEYFDRKINVFQKSSANKIKYSIGRMVFIEDLEKEIYDFYLLSNQ